MGPESALQIAQVGHPTDLVPPIGYGGIGRVVHLLHEVLTPAVTVAPPGSFSPGVLPVEGGPAEMVAAAHAVAPSPDVVITHSPAAAAAARERFRSSHVVEMLHMPVDDASATASSPWHLIGCSAAQLAPVWPARPDARVVWHATPVRPPGTGDGRHAVWVGRFDPSKGPVDAILASREAGVPLILAGKATNDEERQYFSRSVKPLLSSDVSFVGEVSSTDRDALVAASCALLVPTRWAEPFGLTAIEASMVGTPVLGFPAGATREVVSTGIGRVCLGRVEMVEALQTAYAGGFDRTAIAAVARATFAPDAYRVRVLEALSTIASSAATTF